MDAIRNNTGTNTLEPQLLICNNPDCTFRRPMPFGTRFCPNCGKPLLCKGPANKPGNRNKDVSNCIMLETNDHKVKLIDTKCNILYEQSFELLYPRHNDDRRSYYIVKNGDKAYLVHNTGELIEVGDYNEESELAISDDTKYLLIKLHRTAALYRIDSSEIVLISRFRIKSGDIEVFTIIGDYISFISYGCFCSVNINTGEIFRIPGYKFSMIIANRSEKSLYLVSNDVDDEQECHLVDKLGNDCSLFPAGWFFPFNANYFYNRCGVFSINGKEIDLPNDLKDMYFLDETHLMLNFNDYGIRGGYIIYNMEDGSFEIKDECFGRKIMVKGQELPASVEEYDQLIEECRFGHGYSSEYLVNDNSMIVRRIDQKEIYQMDDDEYPIGASDELKRFGIYSNEYISIYDNDGMLLSEFYRPKGIANPELYPNGIILFFDNYLEELSIIDANFKLSVIRGHGCFGGSHEVLSSNCIAVDFPGEPRNWKLYDMDGELILSDETPILSWKKLSDRFYIIETSDSLCEKNGLLLDLQDNNAIPFPFSYREVYLI